MKGEFINRFGPNHCGHDFAVGDIHGRFDLLESALHRQGFDESRDRLFSVGDLVDRGHLSEQSLDWIAKPWFHAVRGNHEQMAIGVAAGRHCPSNYAKNGGEWFLALDADRQQLFASVFDTLPLLIEISHPLGLVGIVHADVGGSWNSFIQQLQEADSKNKARRLQEMALWSRCRIEAASFDYGTESVEGVDVMIVGHTPVKSPTMLANVFYIDTGSHRSGKVTVMEIGAVLEMRRT